MADRNVKAAVAQVFWLFSASMMRLERWLPQLRRKDYSYQCITQFGCCREKTARLVLALYQHVTDRLPICYRHIANCWPTVGVCWPTHSLCLGQNLSADCWLTVGQPTADSLPTQVFWGALLHNYHDLKEVAKSGTFKKRIVKYPFNTKLIYFHFSSS